MARFNFSRQPHLTRKDSFRFSGMFWNRTTGPSNAGCAQANIFVHSGELGVRSAAMKRFI
jgi:hypothetical protein